jgi:type IV secretory pathway VirB10-like protein
MNSIWMKIAGVAVVAIVVIVVVGRFTSDKPSSTSSPPAEKPKTFYDMAERDKQFAQAPKPAEPQPAEQQPPVATPPAPPPTQAPPQPAADNVVLPSSITQRRDLYFKPLSEEDDIVAQELLPWVAAGRSIGRLPMVQYGLMVKACRQAEERWPDSIYAFRAKQALEEIYERYAANYKITRQELDITRFLKPGPGMQAIKVDPIRR